MEEHNVSLSSNPESENDLYWKFGVFYFNPTDKRLFPRKRTGFGWTVNFANPYSVACLLAIILASIIASFYI
jgi:uncharacterized membrane protein